MGLADVLIYDRIVPADGERPVSLPMAMQMLERGEIAPPADLPGELGKLLPPTSALPTPKPRPDPLADIVEQQRAQDRQDRYEMAVRIRAKQLSSPSQHMQLAEQQLREMESRR